MKTLIMVAALCLLVSGPVLARSCTGGICNVCTNCSSCGYCSRGGTCSVCARSHAVAAPAPPPTLAPAPAPVSIPTPDGTWSAPQRNRINAAVEDGRTQYDAKRQEAINAADQRRRRTVALGILVLLLGIGGVVAWTNADKSSGPRRFLTQRLVIQCPHCGVGVTLSPGTDLYTPVTCGNCTRPFTVPDSARPNPAPANLAQQMNEVEGKPWLMWLVLLAPFVMTLLGWWWAQS